MYLWLVGTEPAEHWNSRGHCSEQQNTRLENARFRTRMIWERGNLASRRMEWKMTKILVRKRGRGY